jgi:cellulose synthase/poly-beta-1,6-N-acetylglucosamine synthase-like glycosyltransferase
LSIVVPATDAPATLGRCVAAIRAAAGPGDELVVVDQPAGSSPAAARNAGAGRAVGDVLVFVDADVELHHDALKRLRRGFAGDPVAAVFGAYDDAPAAPGLVSRFRNLLHHHVHASSPGRATTFWTGLGAVRREEFERAGGFDAERFPMPSVEDIDLGMRMSAAGARIRLDPAIQGKHLKPWSLASVVRTDFARRGVPWARLQIEQGRVGDQLNLGWRHRLGVVATLAGVLALISRRPRVAAGAGLALLITHAPFYALLARRGGPTLLGAGIPLHALHHLTAAAALPTALALHARERRARGATPR